MRLLFLFLLFSIHLLCYSQSNSTSKFRNKKADTLATKLKDFIILGVGSTASQVFLGNLTDRMIKVFGDQHVNVEYRYIGKTVLQKPGRIPTFLIMQKNSVPYCYFFLLILPFLKCMMIMDIHSRQLGVMVLLAGGLTREPLFITNRNLRLSFIPQTTGA